MGRACSTHGERRRKKKKNAYRVLVGNPDGKSY
jgi:hypothetical protein